MPRKMIDVVVRRRRWFRGKGNGESALRRLDGLQCCLGFACRTLGASIKTITGVKTPCYLRFPPWQLVDRLTGNDTIVTSFIMRTNDDTMLSDPIREKIIKTLGKEIGLNFSFID